MTSNSLFNEESFSANVNKVPGGVYLCQSDCLSCGACCGMYNLPLNSEEKFYSFLHERTLLFDSVKRDAESIINFGEREEKRIESLGRQPVQDFHHCPFLGLMGDNLDKPGCLLHPLSEKNESVDFRGLSYYGGLACASYFCPTYYDVQPVRKAVVREVIREWYDYGLIITESDMINNIFDIIEAKIGRVFTMEDLDIETSSFLADILKLKLNWPYDKLTEYPVNFFFKEEETLKINPLLEGSDLFHTLHAVKADIKNHDDLKKAEIYINEKISALVELI